MRAHDIAGEIVRPGVPTPTVELAARALGVRPDQVLKSILFLAGDRPVLAVACGTQRIEKSAIAGKYGISRKRVRLATAEELIALSGYQAGGMPPFGHSQALPTLIDSRAAALQTAYAGGGDESAMLRFKPAEILRVSPACIVPLTSDSA